MAIEIILGFCGIGVSGLGAGGGSGFIADLERDFAGGAVRTGSTAIGSSAFRGTDFARTSAGEGGGGGGGGGGNMEEEEDEAAWSGFLI